MQRNKRGAFANGSLLFAASHISCAVALLRLLRLAEPPCRRFCQTQLARAPFGACRQFLAGSEMPASTSALHVAAGSVLVALGSHRPLTPYGGSGIAYGFCSFVGWRVVVGKHISPTPLCCSVGLEVAAATSSLRGVFVCLGLPPAVVTLSAAFFAPYRGRGAIRAVAMGPPPQCSVLGGPPPLLVPPAPKVAPPPRWSGARDIGVPPFGTGLFCRLARWGFYAGWARCARVGSGLRLALVVCRALVSRDTLPSPA